MSPTRRDMLRRGKGSERPARLLLSRFTILFPLLLAACSPATVSDPAAAPSKVAGKMLASGFQGGATSWELKATRYVKSLIEGTDLYAQNSALATGISPIWYLGAVPRDFDLVVGATLFDEGNDGGWGIEFGTKDRTHAYRILAYGSGRLCVDRLFDTYPEFIHCVPRQPEVVSGESYNEIRVRVTGFRVRIWLNGEEIVTFDDDRYEAGGLALAISGTESRVGFSRWELAAVR